MATKYFTGNEVYAISNRIARGEVNIWGCPFLYSLPKGVVYLGHTPGGYNVFLARARGGPRIYAGCRWVKLDDAEKHWKLVAEGSRIFCTAERVNRAKQMIHLVALAKEIARQKKWIKK